MADIQFHSQAPGNKPEPENEQTSLQRSAHSGVRRLRPRIFTVLMFSAVLTGLPIILGRSLPAPMFFALILLLFLTITVLSIILSGLFSQPITRFTKLAERITTGDLYIQIPESEDELGLLARAMNRMTAELRKMLVGMEQTVDQRTSELARASEQMRKRALQLQSVAEVAHAITSIQDPDVLLKQMTELISKNFNFYHVGIFLMDKNEEYAVLQAANSEGGQKMLARGHQLRVGEEGIVGYVSAKGLPRVVTDVGEDIVYINNPDLPYTRSEAAFPLRVGEQIIGVLDVQSMEISSVKEEDVAVLTTLADQVAIAIENARLFRETRNALAELETLHRQYLRQAWADQVAKRRLIGYAYTDGRLLPLTDHAQEDIWDDEATAEFILAPVAGDENNTGADQNNTALIVPVNVRGQTIGVFKLGESEDRHHWNEDEIALVKTIADQVGLAIENARLLEETQHRAEREHLVSEITSKLRASNDPQTILQTAAQELRLALKAKRTQVVAQPSDGMAPQGTGILLIDDPPTISPQEYSQPRQREQQGDGK
jgi:GAF domain-containing protein/HAMP domain-containing protein